MGTIIYVTLGDVLNSVSFLMLGMILVRIIMSSKVPKD